MQRAVGSGRMRQLMNAVNVLGVTFEDLTPLNKCLPDSVLWPNRQGRAKLSAVSSRSTVKGKYGAVC